MCVVHSKCRALTAGKMQSPENVVTDRQKTHWQGITGRKSMINKDVAMRNTLTGGSIDKRQWSWCWRKSLMGYTVSTGRTGKGMGKE